MRILLVHPGASWSTADVEAGLRYGLEHHGCEVIRYRLDSRIEHAGSWLHSAWRRAKKTNPTIQKPTTADIIYHASMGALERALRLQVDVVLIVSASLCHPDAMTVLKRAGQRVVVLFTETPYDIQHELRIAKDVDGCWTTERTAVEAFRAVNPRAGYLPHAWHPERHIAADVEMPDVLAHDVVFVGSGFPERIEWFNAIDWTGIDVGLYGTWKGLGLKPQVEACLKGKNIPNETAAALYRRAAIGLNLYRHYRGTPAESLSPRAYELAACGAFHVSDYRAEVPETFGLLVPTFRTPAEAEALIRQWLPDEAGRARCAAALPASVAASSWVERSASVIGDLQTLLQATRAA